MTTIVGLRPLLGPAKCQFKVGCTQFAIIQLESTPLHLALKNIVFRLVACNPLIYFFRSKR